MILHYMNLRRTRANSPYVVHVKQLQFSEILSAKYLIVIGIQAASLGLEMKSWFRFE